MVKAIVMLSGGLDSLLAVKLLQEQGIDILGINFYSPFFGNKNAVAASEKLGIKFVSIPLEKDYIKMIRKPKHGHGSGMNPCIDCKIFMLKKAKQIMKKEKADFIATGEVLNERPMSQHRKALDMIEEESGLKGKLLRPLSAKLLPETDSEKERMVNRDKLLDIEGRNRTRQIELATKYNIMDYPSPAGGCLLCEKEFAKKLIDLFNNQKKVTVEDAELLKIGRHFRFGKDKIVVARDHEESDELSRLKGIKLELTDFPGPTTLLKRKSIFCFGKKAAIIKAAQLTVYHSKQSGNAVKVKYGRKFNKSILVQPIQEEEVEKLRI